MASAVLVSITLTILLKLELGHAVKQLGQMHSNLFREIHCMTMRTGQLHNYGNSN